MRKSLYVLGAALALSLGLFGCGGDDGDPGPQGAPGVAGPPGPPGPPGPGAADVVNVSSLTAEQWAALQINGEVTDVTIASPPVVDFKLTDANGRPVVGMTTANMRFTVAKLVPGANKSPAHWVNYIVTDNAGALSRPNTETNGTLVDNGDGTYTYTFARDITTMAATVAAATAPAGSDKADLGDLTYDPNLQHRLVIQISGRRNATDLSLEDPANVVYDWVPATDTEIAKADQQKYVVDISSCNTCHDKLAIHGGGRIDTQYCTTCHTTQRAYGRPEVASTNFDFPALTETKSVNAEGITSYSYSPNLYVGDGEVMGNFTTMIHKIHQGGTLVKDNYNYADVVFDKKGFSMLDDGQRMCTVCHDSGAAPQAELAYAKPSREACGACHDGINFATGAGKTLSDGPTQATGHIGRAQQDDSLCDNCHQADQTKIDHRTVNLTTHNQQVADGLVSFTYLIDSVTVDNATGDAKIVFAVQQQTAPSTDKSFATLPLGPNFTGGPSFLLAYALPQDNIANPADYNNLNGTNAQPPSVSLANLVAGTAGTLVASTAKQGYYEATIPAAFPIGAMMRTAALQGYWTQVSPAAPRHTISIVKTAANDEPRRKLADARKCASCHEWFEGHGGNRVIGVETGTGELVCVTCHVPALATSGRGVPDATMLAWPWTADDQLKLREWGMMDSSNAFIASSNIALGFPVTSNNMKDMIHGIHAGRDRVMPFQDARNRGARITATGTSGAITLLDFRRMDFPGTLSNCEGCHGTGTGFNAYNAVPSNALLSRHEAIDAAYAAAIQGGTATPALAAAALDSQSPTDTVVTPYAAACVSCHDGSPAKGHMQTNGARLFVPRSQAVGALEACQTCHGPGAEWDAAQVHK